MPAASKGKKAPAKPGDPGGLDALAEAVESGAGLPAIARAAAKVLDASVALIDRSSAVLAVAGASSDQEKKLIAGGDDVTAIELRVADNVVGELRYRSQKAEPNPAIARMVTTLLGLELERARSPEWESEEVAGAFVGAVLAREVTDRGDILARAAEMGADLEGGAGVLILRASPRSAQDGEWRARVLTLTLRALRSLASGALATAEEGEAAQLAVILPAEDDDRLARAASGLARELEDGLPGFHLTIGHSRRAADAVDLYRAGNEARLAVNVGEAEDVGLLAFEDTGAYRLLLPAISEDPRELERFYAETVAPLSAYDEQYETELVATVEAYLDNDGNVAATAKQLFTHRHTIRYRLERVKELCGHDVSATEGREKLGLGLKAMRVLGIASPRGPAHEPGAEAGKVRRSAEE
jgi:PucR family transcriptional regulator, purine catabolism regulatory protein